MVNDYGSAVCWSELKKNDICSFLHGCVFFPFFFFWTESWKLDYRALMSHDYCQSGECGGVVRAYLWQAHLFVHVNSRWCARGTECDVEGGRRRRRCARIYERASGCCKAAEGSRGAGELHCAASGWRGSWGDWGWSLEIASRGFKSFTASNGFGKPIKAA